VPDDAVQRWDRNAAFWDDQMGADGNSFFLTLTRPVLERLLGDVAWHRVLEIACGNGLFARRMADRGADVVATDGAPGMIERARAYSSAPIDYRCVDAADPAQLAALGRDAFDAVVCNMGLMDMSTIDPLMRGVARLLKPAGRFVFSVSHPCFHNTAATLVAEQSEPNGVLTHTYAVKVANYLHLKPEKGLGIIGQPEPHYYFDRPLHVLFGAGFQAGLMLDGLEEPAFDGAEPAANAFSWANLTEIPPALVARFRLPAQ